MAWKKTFTSLIDVPKFLAPQVRRAQEMTLRELYNDLLDIIQEEVYEGQSIFATTKAGFLDFAEYSNGIYSDWSDMTYQRTGELLDIWEIDKVYSKNRTDGLQVYGGIKPSKYSALTRDADHWIHASKSHGGTMTTYDFAKIINDGLSDNHSAFGELPPRPYWDKFLELANRRYAFYFKKNLGNIIGGGNVGSRMSQGSTSIGSSTQKGREGSTMTKWKWG